MEMTIAQGRKILGEASTKYSDDEVQELIDSMYALSNLIIDFYLERKQKYEIKK